jgi:hypothetical protein
MYVFPASHFKGHVAFEPGRAGEQSVFSGVFLLCAASILLLAVSYFLPLTMRTLWPARQCCQGAENSATSHQDVFSKIITGMTI